MKTTSTFVQAQANHEFAANELMRPEKDVVLLSVCHSVKKAIRWYLISFLETNRVDFSDNENIESLMSKCLVQDVNFAQFSIADLNCKCDEGDCIGKTYCLTMEKVKKCMSIVSDLGAFVAIGK